jgi:chemotaxis protein CheC
MSRAFTAEELDILRELSNIGAGHAATSLSSLLSRRRVSLQVPRVEALQFEEVTDLIGGPESPVVGILLEVRGTLSMEVLLLFLEEDAHRLASLVTGRPRIPLDELGCSALKEVGNILTSSYLNALSQLLGGTLLPSIPSLAQDMGGAVLDSVLATQSRHGNCALVLVNEFAVEEERFVGYFMALPDPEGLDALFEAVQARC